MSMKGRICSLPPSLLRFVTDRLCFGDLVRLYSTFDFELQKLLSFPGVVDTIQLTNPKPVGVERRFLHVLRNVTRVEVLKSVGLPLLQFPLISTLNPLELRLEHAFASSDSFAIRNDEKFDRYIGIEWRQSCLIALDHAAPRLTHLELEYSADYDDGDSLSIYYRFPKTLTSFKLHNLKHVPSWNQLLSALPPTISALSLLREHPSRNLTSLSERFPALHQLEVSSPFLPTADDLAGFGDTLSHLHLIVDNLKTLDLMFNPSILPKLFKLEITTNINNVDPTRTPLDFDNLLPPSIADLTLELTPAEEFRPQFFIDVRILSFPPHLTSLALTFIKVYPTFVDALKSLKVLQKLELYSVTSSIRLVGSGSEEAAVNAQSAASPTTSLYDTLALDSQLLSRSLTHLLLDASDLTYSSHCFLNLPPNLKSLSVASFDLKLFKTFRNYHPRCFLRILKPIDLWASDNGFELLQPTFGMSLTSSTVMSDWASAVLQKCSTYGLQLIVKPTKGRARFATTAVESFSADLNHGSIARLFNYGTILVFRLLSPLHTLKVLKLKLHATHKETLSLDHFPPSLTHLELDGPRATLALPMSTEFSKNLRFISTSSLLDSQTKWEFLPRALTFLDAPNWRISPSRCAKWMFRRFEKLCFRVIDIMDWQVASFLNDTLFDARTRSNMQLSISYGMTGLLLHPAKVFHVTWDILINTTTQKLARQLQSPVPYDTSVCSIPRHKSTLWSTVKALCHTDGLTDSSLSFPPSSRAIRMESSDYWRLTSELGNLPKMTGLMSSFEHLRYLHLERVRWSGNFLFALLPPTLLFLCIATDCSFKSLGDKPPPNLEALILRCKPANLLASGQEDTVLEIRLSALPPSLQYLCIASNRFEFNLPEFSITGALNLPNLKSVLLAGVRPASALLFQLRLQKDNILQVMLRQGQKSLGLRSLGLLASHEATDVMDSLKAASPPALLDQEDASIEKAIAMIFDRAQHVLPQEKLNESGSSSSAPTSSPLIDYTRNR